MAWAVVQSASATVSSGTSIAVGFSSSLGSGHKVIALVSYSEVGGTCTAVKDAAGNSWTQLASVTYSGGSPNVTLWALDVPAGDVGTKPTLTATFTGSGFGASILIQEVSGLLAGNTTAMLDSAVANKTGSSGASTGSATYSSTAASEYLVCCYGDNGGPATYTVPSGYTGDAHGINSNGYADVVIAYKNSTGGSETGSFALSGSGESWVVLAVAFKLASGGGTAYTKSISESVGAGADTLARATAAVRNESESVGAGVDAISSSYGASRALSDGLTAAADAPTRTTADARALAESVSATDALSRSTAIARQLTEALSAADTISRAVAAVRSLPESVAAADAIARLATFLRAPSETSAGASDTAARAYTTARTAADGAGPATDSPSRTAGFGRTPAESIAAATDTAARLAAYPRAPTDGTGPALDAPARLVVLARALTEVMGPAVDSVSNSSIHAYSASLSETVGPALGTFARAYSGGRATPEVLSAADVVGRALGAVRTAAETGSASDSPSRLAAALRAASEAVGAAVDAVSTGGSKNITVSESVGAALDALARAYAGTRSIPEVPTAPLYVDTVLADGPTAWYRLDETSGSVASDSSGNGYTGTIGSAVALNQPGLLGSDADAAMRFAPGGIATEAIVCALPALATTWSWEVWFEGDVTMPASYHYLLSWGTTTSPGLYFNPTWNFIFTPGVNVFGKSGAWNDGQPHHGVVTYDGTTLSVYFDGTLAQSTTSPNPAANLNLPAGNLYIAGDSATWQGVIDEVAVYAYPLTATQVAAHFAAAQPLGASDTVSRQTAASRQLAEAVSSSDALGRAFAGARTLSETLAAAVDSPSRAASHIALITESVGPALDAPARLAVVARALAEVGPAATDAVLRSAAHLAAVLEAVGPSSDALTRGIGSARLLLEAVGPAQDSVSGNGSLTVVVVETVGPASDAPSRQTVTARQLAEAVLAADSADRLVAAQRATAESVLASDLVDRLVAVLRSPAESVLAVDAATRLLVAGRFPVETVGPAFDVLGNASAHSAFISESAGPALDSADRLLAALRSVAETTLAVGDSVTQQLAAQRQLSESVSVADLWLRQTAVARSPVEAVTAYDTPSRLLMAPRLLSEAVGPAADANARATALARQLLEALAPADDVVQRQLDLITRFIAETAGPALDVVSYTRPELVGPLLLAVVRAGLAQVLVRDGSGLSRVRTTVVQVKVER